MAPGIQQATGNEIGKGISKIGVMSWSVVQENLFHNKKRKTSGLTHGDDFVVTGTKGSLLELKQQPESVYPIKASIIGAGSTRGVKALNRRICWERQECCINTVLDTLTFSLRVLALENGSTVQTPIIDGVNDENPKIVRSFTTQLFQIEATPSVPEGSERQWIQVFEFGHMRSQVTVSQTYTGLETKKRGKHQARGVALVGRHVLKAYARIEKIIAGSSA